MANVSDLEDRVRTLREYILEDRGMYASLRSFDAIAELMVEMIRELREIKEELYSQGGRDA